MFALAGAVVENLGAGRSADDGAAAADALQGPLCDYETVHRIVGVPILLGQNTVIQAVLIVGKNIPTVAVGIVFVAQVVFGVADRDDAAELVILHARILVIDSPYAGRLGVAFEGAIAVLIVFVSAARLETVIDLFFQIAVLIVGEADVLFVAGSRQICIPVLLDQPTGFVIRIGEPTAASINVPQQAPEIILRIL